MSAPEQSRKHIARKRFGQHFLVDQSVIAAIVRAIAPRGDDMMVEIGPGLGALTMPLVDARRQHEIATAQQPLHVIELDRDLAARLRLRYTSDELIVHEADALAFDFSRLASDLPARLRVVGNLPYNISSPLLFHLADFSDAIVDQHFMLQKEVVDRMVAAPGTSDYGRLSVMLQVRYDMEAQFDVPPAAFDPAPKVTSALVRMAPRADAGIRDFPLFARLVSQAFSQRRKMLRNTLKDRIAEMEAIGIAPTARAEDVSVDDYVALANRLAE